MRWGTHPVALQEQGGLPGLGLHDGGGRLLLRILAILSEHLRLERREELGHRSHAGAAAHLPSHALPSATAGERPATTVPRKAGGEGPDRNILRRGSFGHAQGERRERGRHVQQHGGRGGGHFVANCGSDPIRAGRSSPLPWPGCSYGDAELVRRAQEEKHEREEWWPTR